MGWWKHCPDYLTNYVGYLKKGDRNMWLKCQNVTHGGGTYRSIIDPSHVIISGSSSNVASLEITDANVRIIGFYFETQTGNFETRHYLSWNYGGKVNYDYYGTSLYAELPLISATDNKITWDNTARNDYWWSSFGGIYVIVEEL